MFLVFSTSLNPDSRSRILARTASKIAADQQADCQLIDLSEKVVPTCDGDRCYLDPVVQDLAHRISQAKGILIASPVYNYGLSASAKNLIELTGAAWKDKVVGFLCAAGGQGSYMAPVSLANSLMLDFRCLILPRFVYTTEGSFRGDQISDSDIEQRLHELVDQLIAITAALENSAIEKGQAT